MFFLLFRFFYLRNKLAPHLQSCARLSSLPFVAHFYRGARCPLTRSTSRFSVIGAINGLVAKDPAHSAPIVNHDRFRDGVRMFIVPMGIEVLPGNTHDHHSLEIALDLLGYQHTAKSHPFCCVSNKDSIIHKDGMHDAVAAVAAI